MGVLKVIKKNYKETVDFSTTTSNIVIAGTTYVTNWEVSDWVGAKIAEFLKECGREDVSYDSEKHYLYISGAPLTILAYQLVAGAYYRYSFGFYTPNGLLSYYSTTVTSTTTVAYPNAGGIWWTTPKEVVLGLRFVGSNKGPFTFAVGSSWYASRTSTSTSTWTIGYLTVPTYGNASHSLGVVFGKNPVSGNKVVLFSRGGTAMIWPVEVGEDGTNIDWYWTGSGAANPQQDTTYLFQLGASAGIDSEIANQRAKLIPIPAVGVSQGFLYTVPENVYLWYSAFPASTGLFADSQTTIQVDGRTFWIQKSLLNPATSPYGHWFSIAEVID